MRSTTKDRQYQIWSKSFHWFWSCVMIQRIYSFSLLMTQTESFTKRSVLNIKFCMWFICKEFYLDFFDKYLAIQMRTETYVDLQINRPLSHGRITLLFSLPFIDVDIIPKVRSCDQTEIDQLICQQKFLCNLTCRIASKVYIASKYLSFQKYFY
jgi:hypothetical protein